ncbi:MAG: hypothetical protein AAGD11_08870 [Planctomycetota bacterium]
MLAKVKICAQAVLLFIVWLMYCPQVKAGPTGDTFEFGLSGWYFDPALQNVGGSGWGWFPTGEASSGLATITQSFTFGTPGTYDFLGNTLIVDSQAISTGSDTERWLFRITAQDGGLLFNPDVGIFDADTNPLGYRAFHLRQLTLGEFAPWTSGDPLNDPNFATFQNLPDPYEGLGDWINESSGVSFFDANGPADYTIGPYDDADFSRNLVVDGADFLGWQQNYFSFESRFDADGNGFVDEFDLMIWGNEYSETSSPYSLDDMTLWAIEQPTGVYLNRSFGNLERLGVIMFDDGVNSPNDSEITRIEMYVDVRVNAGSVVAVPELGTALLLLVGGSLGFVCRFRGSLLG